MSDNQEIREKMLLERAGNNDEFHISNQQNDQDSIDILRYFQVLCIHKWICASIFLVILSLITYYFYIQPKFYTSEFEIFHNESIKEFIIESDVPVIKSNFDKIFWLSKMRSDELNNLTLKNSGLPYSTTQLASKINVEIKETKGSTTPIFKVKITSYNSTDIPIIISAFVKSINELLVKNQIDNSMSLIQFLTNQIEESNNKIGQIERRILRENPDSVFLVRDYSKMASELESFRAALLNSQIDLSSVKASRIRTESELNNLDGTVVNETALSEPLKVQLMNLQVDLARSLTKNREEHPTIKSLRDNIEQVQKLLKDSIQHQMQISNYIQNPLKMQLMSKLLDMKLNEISLETKVISLQQVITDYERLIMPDTSNCKNNFYKDRELLTQTINILNTKLIEAQSATHGNISRFILIDEPVEPKNPANRPLIFYFLIAIFGGAAVGVGAIVLYDLLDNRIMLVGDYEKFFTNVPVSGVIMHNSKINDKMHSLLYSEDETNEINEVGDIILDIKRSLKTGNKVFSISSPSRFEGKSIVTLYLAISLAKKGLKVLLVDMDFYGPKLSKKLDQHTNPGVIDYMLGDICLETLFQNKLIPNLTVTPAGRTKTPAKFSYDSKSISEFISVSKQMYDVILFDTPAVLIIPDVVHLLEQSDNILLVARLSKTTRTIFTKFLKVISENRSKILGTILNDVKRSSINSYTDKYVMYKYDYKYSQYD